MSVRYFFDVTDIKHYLKTHTTISGIQRVSLEVIRETVRTLGADKVYLCLWDKRRASYTALSTQFMAQMDGIDVDMLTAVLHNRPVRAARSISPLLGRYRNAPVKYHVYRTIAQVQALRGNESYFAKRGSSLAQWRQKPDPQGTTAPPAVTRAQVSDIIRPKDHLIILGAAWGFAGFDTYMQKLKDDHGVHITQQVHDLIPLVMPHHLMNEFSLEFYRWLESTTRYCSHYIVAAKNTRRDLERFMDEVGTHHPVTVIPFARKLSTAIDPPAPTTFKGRAEALSPIPQDIRNKTKVPYVLVVGTMESRKNLWRLVQAWDRLTREDGIDMPKLILAGRQGWFNEDLMDWMNTSGNLRGWVQFTIGPTDEELAYLYRNCLFTATVSLYEGWGLPIGESLGFGKTAVVADNSAMPEVGGDLVVYCDATSVTSIAQACRTLITDPDHRRALEDRIAATDLRGWDDVAADYIAALISENT